MNPQKPILVYYKMRANIEIIRMGFYEIGIQFDQQFISHSGIPEKLTEKYDLDVRDVPYLIHEGMIINGAWPILKYLCKKYGRMDLLGKTLEDQIRVSEIFSKYMTQRNMLIHYLCLNLEEMIKVKDISTSLPFIKTQSCRFLNQAKFFQALKKMSAQTNNYLRNHMTVIDFLFFSICSFIYEVQGSKLSDTIIMKYLQFFKKTDFFLKYKQQLQKYPYYNEEIDTNVRKLIKMSIRAKNKVQSNFTQMNDD